MMNLKLGLVTLMAAWMLSGCLQDRRNSSTTPENQASRSSGGNNGGGGGEPQRLAVNPAAVAGPRTYCIWADPATERAAMVLVQMGYDDAHFSDDATRVVTLPPRNGYSLQVELTNLIGSTRVNATADTNSQPAQSAIAEFYSRYENNLQQGQCPDGR